MDINVVAVLVPMILGFIAVVVSIHGLIRSDMNRRFTEQEKNNDRRFFDQEKSNDRRFSELKEDIADNKKEIQSSKSELKAEIGEIRIDMKELRNRLDMYIDSFAVRVMAGSLQKKSARK